MNNLNIKLMKIRRISKIELIILELLSEGYKYYIILVNVY